MTHETLLEEFLTYRNSPQAIPTRNGRQGQRTMLSPRSQRAYRQDVTSFLEYLSDRDITLDTVTDQDAIDYFKSKDYSKNTAERKTSSLFGKRGFFWYLNHERDINSKPQPAHILEEIDTFIKPSGVGITITDQEFSEFAKTVMTHGIPWNTTQPGRIKELHSRVRDVVAASLFYRAALSPTQLAELVQSDICITDATLNLDVTGTSPRNFSYTVSKEHYPYEAESLLRFPDITKQYKATLPTQTPASEKEQLFLGGSGGSITNRGLRRSISLHAKGIDFNVNPQILINSHIARSWEQGISSSQVADQLGMRKAAVREHYRNLAANAQG